jgi:hypothetical protein
MIDRLQRWAAKHPVPLKPVATLSAFYAGIVTAVQPPW